MVNSRGAVLLSGGATLPSGATFTMASGSTHQFNSNGFVSGQWTFNLQAGYPKFSSTPEFTSGATFSGTTAPTFGGGLTATGGTVDLTAAASAIAATQTAGDSSTKLATTAFSAAAITALKAASNTWGGTQTFGTVALGGFVGTSGSPNIDLSGATSVKVVQPSLTGLGTTDALNTIGLLNAMALATTNSGIANAQQPQIWYQKTVAQNLAAGTTLTNITGWTNASSRAATGWTYSGATFTATYGGCYDISLAVCFDGTTTGGRRRCAILQNGNSIGGSEESSGGGSGQQTSCIVTIPGVVVAAGDVFTVQGFQSSTVSLAVMTGAPTYFSAVRNSA